MGSRRTLMGIAAVATALAVVTAGCSGGGSKAKPSVNGSSGSASGADANSPDAVAAAFLAAWQAGDYKKAGSLTDLPDKAGPRLESVMKSLAPKSIQLTLGSVVAAAPPSSAASTSTSASGSAASSSAAGTSSGTADPEAGATHYNFNVVDTFDGDLKWTYTSVLAVIPANGSTPPLIHWKSAVINPQLTVASTLKAVPPSVPVADRNGVVLTAQAHPSLAGVLSKLAIAKPSGGMPTSLQIQFLDVNTGNQIAGSTPVQLGTPTSAAGLQLASTLDEKIQTAAEQATAAFPESGMVVIKPSTGEILAIASNSKTAAGLAYHATRAPGSTFKTITAATLMQQAGMKLTDPADCTPDAKVGTQTYHNDKDLASGVTGLTLLTAYEASCNTSFVNAVIQHNLSIASLSQEAHDFFGMNQPWDMGIGQATYCTGGNQQVPPADGKERLAAEAFGQGNILMCPLTMASVAATVATGQFHQPVLIPGFQAPASAQALPGDVAANLRTMMMGVITNGTASSLKGISPTLGAKTGSAEPNKTDKTDSWMIAMDPAHDIAVGALVLNGGFGNAASGPMIASMMQKAGLS